VQDFSFVAREILLQVPYFGKADIIIHLSISPFSSESHQVTYICSKSTRKVTRNIKEDVQIFSVTYICAKSSHHKGLVRLLGLHEVENPRISRQSANEGGKVVIATRLPPLPQETPLVLISVRGRVDHRDILRTEGNEKYHRESNS
jgi:hypothetical protein